MTDRELEVFNAVNKMFPLKTEQPLQEASILMKLADACTMTVIVGLFAGWIATIIRL